MGSTSLGALLEKYGYINLPFRKFFLSEYIMGLRNINDKAMQYRFIETINSLTNKTTIGGVSVKDRNSREGRIRSIKPNEKNIEKFLSFKPKNINDLISHCFLFAAQHMIYKEFNIPLRGFIIYEMPQFKRKYNFTQFEYINKLKSLDNFILFVMQRSFKEWCASLLSQEDFKLINSRSLNTISLEKLLIRWEKVENLSQIDQIHSINLNELLLPNTLKTNKLISSILKLNTIKYDAIENGKYDLFGSLLFFQEAFKPSDYSFNKLNPIFKILLESYPKIPLIMRFIADIFFNIMRKIGFFRTYKLP